MIFALLSIACSRAPADAAPFQGVLDRLDTDHDGVVTVGEYPAAPPAGATAKEVDRDRDGRISTVEVRDEVYALDPSAFDRMAWKRSARDLPKDGSRPSERSITGTKPPQGPLVEALRFLEDLAVTRRPDLPGLPAEALEAAAAAGMASEPGAVVLTRLAEAGVALPEGLATAPADPLPAPELPSRGLPPKEETLRSQGPGGREALRGRGRVGEDPGSGGGAPPAGVKHPGGGGPPRGGPHPGPPDGGGPPPTQQGDDAVPPPG